MRRFCTIIIGLVFFTSGLFKLIDPVGTGLIVRSYLEFVHVGFLGGVSGLAGFLLSAVEALTGLALLGGVEGVQIDCISHSYPWIKPHIIDNGIRLASLEDICAMKLNAIAGNGTRIKDFIDVAYLSAKFSLQQMLDFYEQKYHANPLMPLKGLVYFADIDKTAPVKMADGKPLKWNKIEKRLLAMEKNTDKVFESYPC